MPAPAFDVVVFGATSFVGQILCRYLLAQFGGKGKAGLRWAMAARSNTKLAALKAELGAEASSMTLITADSADETSLRAMCAQTRVVASTVGPYALYGDLLVKVCAQSGTDYCDLTGETPWIARMIKSYEASAQQSGARIVPCCGFDSIPSDLGVWFVQRLAREQFGAPCNQIKMRVKKMRGGASGGTVASMLNIVKEARSNAQLRRELANPYSLCPPDYRAPARQTDLRGAKYERDFDAWCGPFVMAAINTRVVFRSNSLLAREASAAYYGDDFCYDEAMLTGQGFAGRSVATGLAAGLVTFTIAAAIAPTRWLMTSLVLPAPGQGPSPRAQENGFYDIRFIGRTAAGKVVAAKVTGDRDPGYGSTAKMLGQAATCLALDIRKTGKDSLAGGFWTPATAFGDKLISRLTAHSGLVFEKLPQ